MPAAKRLNEDKDIVDCYENLGARGFTVTGGAVVAAEAMRREAAGDVQFWAAQKTALGRFAKDQQKAAQRIEKACTIWLLHFTEVGHKSITHMPRELAEELDLAFGRMALAQ